MIPSVNVFEKHVEVPVYGTDLFCHIVWEEGETVEDAMKRASGNDSFSVYTRFKVWPSDSEEDETYSGYEVGVYEVICSETHKKYYLISSREMDEFDDVLHSVCVPYNKLNLLKFFSEYLCPIGQTCYIND